MTIKELASLTNQLYREGKGDLPVFFIDGPIAYPLIKWSEEDILISSENSPKAICFSGTLHYVKAI